MFQPNPALAIDFYKADHRRQYPTGTTEVYSNLTPRSDHHAFKSPGYPGGVVVFGLQALIDWFFVDYWERNFFHLPHDKAVLPFKRRMDSSLGAGAVPVDHIEELWRLGHLPLHIKGLDEGSICPMKVPLLTIRNTHPDFGWLTNSVETMLSAELWHPITSATTALQFRRTFEHFADLTGTPREVVQFQGHDFSFRGMEGLFAAMPSGAGHLLSFAGTDTVPAIDWLEYYYGATGQIGGSVPATEHSVMCMGGVESEAATFERLITDLYPSGFVSIVSDTWDFWSVVTDLLPSLKGKIMARDGRVVIRPDSGDPVAILCGDPAAPEGSPEYRGLIACLWDIFGGTTTFTGHRQLDSHIGTIYGDSINLQRQEQILARLAAAGFASGNVVFGVGSFSYQYVTRDTFGIAMKATSGVVNGVRQELFKEPKTDSGTKKSARGLLRVDKVDGTYVLREQVSEEEEAGGELKTRFLNGKQVGLTALEEIRARVGW